MTEQDKIYWRTMIAAIAKDHVQVERQRVDESKYYDIHQVLKSYREVKGTQINDHA